MSETIDLDTAMAVAAASRQATVEAEREAKRQVRVAWVSSRIGTRTRSRRTQYQCPDCCKWVSSPGEMQRQHGWDLVNGRWPGTACCSSMVTERHVSFPRFAASSDAMGCGPLREPWTTAKRFHVMEEHLFLRDVLVPWERSWAPTRVNRVVPQEVSDAW